jgi:hypothetical protein
MLAESKGLFFDFDSKREEDKNTLKTVSEIYKALPLVMSHGDSEASQQAMLEVLCATSEDKFVKSNWMVRQAILTCYQAILKLIKSGTAGQVALEFCLQLLHKAAEFGEKYDQNLVYLSEIALVVGERADGLSPESR